MKLFCTKLTLLTLSLLGSFLSSILVDAGGLQQVDPHRELKTDECSIAVKPCNEIISVDKVDDLIEYFEQKFTYLKNTYKNIADVMDYFLEELIPQMQYDVGSFKVCAKCDDFEDLDDGYGCKADDYGHDQTHSGLLGLPVTADENGDYKVINAKKLQAFFQFTVVTIAPVDLDNQVYTDFGYANDFAKIAAALGMVSVIPEKTGYGEASDLIMSPFVKTSLTTSTLPLFEKAKAIVKEMSDGKAKLADEVYFQGFSEGGYSALAAADGFNQNGIKVLKVFASGAPIKLASSTIFTIFATIFTSPDSALKANTLFLAVYAILPYKLRGDIDDAGQGVAAEWGGSFEDLFRDQCAPSVYTAPEAWNVNLYTKHTAIATNAASAMPTFIDAKTINFFAAAVQSMNSKPCDFPSASNYPDSFCKILLENDLEKSVENASYDIALCHSAEDELVSYGNVVEPRLVLTVDGNHRESGATCQYNMFATFLKQSYKEPKKSSKSAKSAKSAKNSNQLRKTRRV